MADVDGVLVVGGPGQTHVPAVPRVPRRYWVRQRYLKVSSSGFGTGIKGRAKVLICNPRYIKCTYEYLRVR